METVQHVSPGMPTQAPISYPPRPSIQYNLSNPGSLPLGSTSNYKVSSAQAAPIPSYPSYPISSDLPARYVSQTSQYGSLSVERSNSTNTSYNDNSHITSVIGRNERCNNPNSGSLIDHMPPKSRAVFNSSEHRNIYPNRINTSEVYLDSTLNSLYHVEHGAPPNKRIKYNEIKPEIQQPLRIDTSERPIYNPPVEAISPTLPPAPPPQSLLPRVGSASTAASNVNSPELLAEVNQKQDEAVISIDFSSLSNIPNDLVDLLMKIEDEIKKANQQIQYLKKKQKESEDTPNFRISEETDEISYDVAFPLLMKVAKKVYNENWDNACVSHQYFVKLGPMDDLPMYNQAPDTEIYHENKKKYALIRPNLIDKIRKEKVQKESRDQMVASSYNKLSAEWKRKVEKVENSQKRKARDLRNREVFEKVFPELRKQREDKERFSRSGGRVRSEADLEEIMDGLQEQELEDKKMRSYAVIPPLMLDLRQRRYSFINDNGLITDLPKVAKENEYFNIWTETEKEIFKEKFLQHPKNFGVIASYLEKKNGCECVAYYYMSKKTEHYKRLLRKSRRTRTRNIPGNKASGTNSVGPNPGDLLYNNTPGVTTRLQREQIQQQQRLEQPQNLSVAVSSLSTPVSVSLCSTVTEVSAVDGTSNETNIASLTTSGFLNTADSCLTTKTTTQTSMSSINRLSSSINADSSSKMEVDNLSNDNDTPLNAHESIQEKMNEGPSSLVNAANNSGIPSEMKTDTKKKEKRKEDKKKNGSAHVGDTSEEDILLSAEGNDKSTYPCLVCKNEATSSRALPKSHAHQYGLKEEEITPGARVCNLCRCKAVRLRCTPCPLPTCPNTKGSRVKRLRPLPCKWAELPQHIKQPVILEFQVPNTATKCCSACFNRIQRRLVALGVVPIPQTDDTSESPTPPSSSQLLKWTDEETEALKRGLIEHGTKWSEVSQIVGSSKSQYQCKNFYFNYRKKRGLDAALQEYNKTHFGEERKPTLSTDEEESGSTTSSCDELDQPMLDDSDTTSAPSPSMKNDSGVLDSAVIIKSGSNLDSNATTDVSISTMSNASPLKCTPPVISNLVMKEDYDSSATETADEGIGTGGENENVPSTLENNKLHLFTAARSSSDREILMADMMHELIEFQLKKPASQLPNLSLIPNNISSIVDQNLIECDRRQQKARENSAATLSVVNSAPHNSHHNMIKDKVVYLQMTKKPPRDSEVGGTLDLSMKKSRSPEFMNSHKLYGIQTSHPSQNNNKSGAVGHIPLLSIPSHHQSHLYKNPNVGPHDPGTNYYHHQLVEVGKSGEGVYPWKMQPPLVMQPHPIMVKQSPSTHVKKREYHASSPHQLNPNLKLSPKQSPNGISSSNLSTISLTQQSKMSGSIMQGTPVSNTALYPPAIRDNRYDPPLMRQITPPSHQNAPPPLVKESGGSITQGTPVHQRGGSHSNSSAEYYPQANRVPPANFYPNRPHSYNDEQRHQIIMTDFVTSNKLRNMQQRDKNPYYYPPGRVNVITRHNTSPNNLKSTSPHSYPPPGHEALNSLVDVAVRQPSLPVPMNSSSVSQLKDDKRLIVQEGLGERFPRDVVVQDRYLPRDHREVPDKFARDVSMHHQSLYHADQLRDQQMRESRLHRERERERERDQRQQEHIYHYREQHMQKIREHERIREQSKHLMPGQILQSLRENHIQQIPPPSSSTAPLSVTTVVQTTSPSHLHHISLTPPSREDPHQQYRTISSLGSRMVSESHVRLQRPPAMYTTSHRTPSLEVSVDASLLLQSSVSTNTVSLHREAQASSSLSASKSDALRTQSNEGRHAGGVVSDSNTLTAASLIDAIITHQINQPSEPTTSSALSQSIASAHPPGQRPGEKLFQVFPEPDGKSSPMKSALVTNRASPDTRVHQNQSPAASLQPSPTPISSLSPAISSTIITTCVPTSSNFSSASTGTTIIANLSTTIAPSVSQSQNSLDADAISGRGAIYAESHAWKLRRVLQQKEIEQADRNILRIASGNQQRPTSPREKLGLQGCPFDYVKNKIVEVMHRTSDDDSLKSSTPANLSTSYGVSGGNALNTGEDSGANEQSSQQQHSSYLPASNYTYPYSALNINSPVPVTAHTGPAITPKPVEIPEPTPILSSQYEPLSDED